MRELEHDTRPCKERQSAICESGKGVFVQLCALVSYLAAPMDIDPAAGTGGIRPINDRIHYSSANWYQNHDGLLRVSALTWQIKIRSSVFLVRGYAN